MSSQSTLSTQSRHSHPYQDHGADMAMEDSAFADTAIDNSAVATENSDEVVGEQITVAPEGVVRSDLVRPQLPNRQQRSLHSVGRWMRSSKTMLLLISALCIGLFVSSILLAV